MPRLVCFIYTQTNGLHGSNEFVTKKNMFEFARPVSLNYVIGYKQGSRRCNDFKLFLRAMALIIRLFQSPLK